MRGLLILGLGVFCTAACLGNEALAAPRPNILFVLVDDLAWADASCYGHAWHETPHLDRLAREGMRFTQAYAPAPICSASRASILTGKSPARLGFEFVTKNEPGRQKRGAGQALRTPPFTLNLPTEETTLAECLAGAGYETAFFGKWHVSAHHGGYLGWSPTHGPRQQGFQTAAEDFGSHPYSYRKSGPPQTIAAPGTFPADSMTERAAKFLQRKHERPFFLMVSHFYVHTPVRTPCAWLIEKYERRVPADAPHRRRRIEYAAFVETLDHYVGQLLAALDASGAGDDTLVVFTSDNGGHPEYAANGPLRGSKWNLYEGGIREPLVVRWPGHIAAGSTCDTPVVGYDLLPTLAEVAGADLPETELDGLSLVTLFQDPATDLDRGLFWHFPYYHPEGGFERARPTIGVDDFAVSQTRPHSAIRRGPYKLLYFYEDGRSELYRLSDDASEAHQRAAENPAKAAELRKQLTAYLKDVGARLPDEVKAEGERQKAEGRRRKNDR